jgi:hypothetical protein
MSLFLPWWPTHLDVGSSTEMGLPSKQAVFSGYASNGYSLCLLSPVLVKPSATEKPRSEPVGSAVDAQVRWPSEELEKWTVL